MLGHDGAMPLDPNIAGFLQFIAEAGYPPMHEGTPDTARKAMRAMTVDLVTDENRIPVGSVSERSITTPHGETPVRIYRPEGDGPFPTLVYVHGGGFVIGDLDTHDQTCRRIARDAEVVVMAVDYRLAPEHVWPAAVDDVLAAVAWAADHLDELGGSPVLSVGGDSAGGNLSAIAAQEFRDRLAAQLLIYPAVDVAGEYPSREENAEGYLLEQSTMEWFFSHYVPAPIDDLEVAAQLVTDPRLSPLYGDLAQVPPAVVVTAEFDPLRDEGEAYADALARAGVQVDAVRYDGVIHGFIDLGGFSPVADAAVADMITRFKALVHR